MPGDRVLYISKGKAVGSWAAKPGEYGGCSGDLRPWRNRIEDLAERAVETVSVQAEKNNMYT